MRLWARSARGIGSQLPYLERDLRTRLTCIKNGSAHLLYMYGASLGLQRCFEMMFDRMAAALEQGKGK